MIGGRSRGFHESRGFCEVARVLWDAGHMRLWDVPVDEPMYLAMSAESSLIMPSMSLGCSYAPSESDTPSPSRSSLTTTKT